MKTVPKHSNPRISVSVSLPTDTRDLARQAAFDDNRPLSGLIHKLVEDYLEREGYRERRPSRAGGRKTTAAEPSNRQPSRA